MENDLEEKALFLKAEVSFVKKKMKGMALLTLISIKDDYRALN